MACGLAGALAGTSLWGWLAFAALVAVLATKATFEERWMLMAHPEYAAYRALGKQTIAECNRLGVVVDVAHATMEFVEAAAKVCQTPLLLSHTAVAKRDGRMNPFTRLISSAHAKLVAQTGGVVGIWASPFGYKSIDQWVDGIAHAVDTVGADHVGMGTDNSGFGTSPAVWDDYSDFPQVVQSMRRRGFSAQEIRKIGGGNYVRLFNQSMRA
jgi:membrane dipeptidase